MKTTSQPASVRTVTGLTPAEEKAAVNQVLNLLRTLRDLIRAAVENQEDLHWVNDLKELTPDAALFLFQTLGRGEVTVKLYGGEASATETEIPGLWKMKIGPQTSLVAGRLPRSVIAAVSTGDTNISLPDTVPQGVVAAPALLTELQETLQKTDLSVLPETAVPQIDLLHQPLTPADLNYLFTTLGTGKTTVDITGFARTHMDSTRVKGLWRTRIVNNAGKPLLDALTVALIPPEVPAGSDDWEESLTKLTSAIEWIENDLARGVLG